jgi:hypothetical protein
MRINVKGDTLSVVWQDQQCHCYITISFLSLQKKIPIVHKEVETGVHLEESLLFRSESLLSLQEKNTAIN